MTICNIISISSLIAASIIFCVVLPIIKMKIKTETYNELKEIGVLK